MEQGLSLLIENLQETIITLATEKAVTPRNQIPPWINPELHLLMSKRGATNRRYCRSRYPQLLEKFLDFANVCEERNEAARCAYMHNRMGETLDNGKNFWKELLNLGLIPKTSDALHGFIPDELNDYFSRIFIFPDEDPAESLNILATASSDGFRFSSVTSV